MNKKMLILTLLSLLNISYLFSQSNILEIPYTFRPSDARGTALGLTGTAYSEGLFSIYTNPAGLSFMKKAMISYSHYPKIKYGIDDKKGRYNQENLGLALRINKNLFVAVNYLYLNLGEHSYTTEHSPKIFKYESGIKIYSFSASGLIVKGKNSLSIGTNAKYYEEKLDPNKENILWFDVGIQCRHKTAEKEIWGLGLSITNLGGDLKKGPYILSKPMQLFRCGLYYIKDFSELNLGLLGTVEYQKTLAEKTYYSYDWNRLGTGLELQFFSYMYGRMGYNFKLENKEDNYTGFTYGMGFKTPQKLSKKLPIFLAFNYGRTLKQYLGDFDENIISVEVIVE